ncbi:uncharacterized protein LOC123564949 [Mercenaria mercenaria]|uniref:uncharacterized protein LOC123564949 n=1 Tax=Mercenaria mercenaria TaxID=6596 RepID=UPI00234E5AE7|nr:uncharacterized protein LOC123564949 [Mercenaria mercenaria]
MTSRWIKVGGVALACGVVSEIVYFLYKRFRKRRWQYQDQSESESRKEIEEVLFFPDSQVACKNYFIGEYGCDNRNCRFTHIPNSLSRLYEFIASAEKSLDVCVFVICCAELADMLVEAQRKNIKVRVICDDEQVDITGSQIWKLRKEGINVRTDSSSYLMHHKFLIVDGSLLLNGSFNWTRQAISGNQENLMALNNGRIVTLYRAEFEKLWNKFNPRNQ